MREPERSDILKFMLPSGILADYICAWNLTQIIRKEMCKYVLRQDLKWNNPIKIDALSFM